MNGHGQSEQYQRNTNNYLKETENSFRIDPSSGLYYPKADHGDSDVSQDCTGHVEEQPFFAAIRTEWTDRVPALAAIFALVISVATLILLGLTVYWTKRQWSTSNDIFKQVKQQTGSFKKANDINRGAAVVSQRAYVNYPVDKTLSQLTTTTNGTTGFLYHMVMENGGNTPAFDVRVRLSDNASLGFKRLPPKFSFPNARLKNSVFSAIQKEDVTPEIINPRDLVGGPALVLPDEVLRDVNSGKKFVFLWGKITYRDVFNCGHETEFCVQMVSVMENGAPVLATCPEHNCADGDCPDFKPTNSEVCKQESNPFPASGK